MIIYCLLIVSLQKVQERWYEKLHEWEKALNAYERQQEKNPDDTNFLYGRMRCLEALGEWYAFFHVSTSCALHLVLNTVSYFNAFTEPRFALFYYELLALANLDF